MNLLRRLYDFYREHQAAFTLVQLSLASLSLLLLLVYTFSPSLHPAPLISPLAFPLTPYVPQTPLTPQTSLPPPCPTCLPGTGPPPRAPTLTPLPSPTPSPDTSSLNLSFENGYSSDPHHALQISPDGLHHVTYLENANPASWTTFYYEGETCPGTDDWSLGRPEVHLTSYPGRFYDGTAAAFVFTTWRCHKAGLYQRIPVVPGKTYRATCHAHFWYADCSQHATHPCPLSYDCETCYDWATATAYLGIDPTGGIDPRSQDITWSSPQSTYGTYSSYSLVTYATIPFTSTYATLFIADTLSHPLHHGDFYVDACTLTQVQTSYWPLFVKDLP